MKSNGNNADEVKLSDVKREEESQTEQKEKKEFTENKMGVMPVKKLLISMAVPLMVSNFVQALYNIVDSIFVSRITTDEKIYDAGGELISAGTDAISALGLAFPIQIVIIALGIGTSVGVSSALSKALGERKQKLADKIAMHGIFLVILSYIVSLVIGIFFARMVIAGQGATGRKLEYGTTYLRIVCCCSIAVYLEIMLERLLQSTGRTHLSMIPQMTGAVINVIMDPILIFGLLGIPKMGVAGAALATVFGQIVASLLGVYLNVKKNPDINLYIKGFRPEAKIIKRIYVVGAPAIFMQAVGSIMNFAMNGILLGLNAGGVAVFTVYYKLQSFFFMPLFGMNAALVPIIAYNYGAQKKKRITDTYKASLLYSFMLILVGFILFEVIPDKLLMIFDTGDKTLLTLGVPALRIIGVHYLLAWFCIMTGGLFQALGNGMYSFINAIMRQLVVLIPAAFILGKIGGISLVWWCFPIAELSSLTVSSIFLKKIYKDIINKIPEQNN